MNRFTSRIKQLTICVALILLCISCSRKDSDPKLTNKDIAKVLEEMTQLMIQDVSNPPLAARFYTYACISGYTVLALNDSTVIPLKVFQ